MMMRLRSNVASARWDSIVCLVSLCLMACSTAPTVAADARVETAKVTASDGKDQDYFGGSVSISGTYAIVGARFHRVGPMSESGAVYVFERDGAAWNQVAIISRSDPGHYEEFGSSVSISGDFAIVGTPYDPDDADYDRRAAGSAYVFQRDGSVWNQVAKLTASDGQGGDYFGGSVAISGGRAIVGTNMGSAYVFERSGSTWSQVAKLTSPVGRPVPRYGRSVSISGDYAVVGHQTENTAFDYAGAVYVYQRSVSGWNEVARLTPPDAAYGDHFGTSVSINGDRLIVGAYYDGDRGVNSGSAYVYERDGLTWSQVAKLIAPDGAAYDRFGESVSMGDDYVVVGAPYDDNGAILGSAHLFQGSGLVWDHVIKLTPSDGTVDHRFGVSVAASGAYALIGATLDDERAANAGAAYVFDVPEPGTLSLLVLGTCLSLFRRRR